MWSIFKTETDCILKNFLIYYSVRSLSIPIMAVYSNCLLKNCFLNFSKFLLVKAQDYEYWNYESSVIKTIKRSYFAITIYFLCLIKVSKLYFGLRVTTTFNSWIKNTEYNNEANDQVSDFKWRFPSIALSGSLFWFLTKEIVFL